MPKISFGGLASGLPANMVDQLVEAERIPIKTQEVAKGKQEARLKLVTELETKLNGITSSIGGLANTRGFSDIKLESGDVNILNGVVDPTKSQTGNWNVEVMQLAQKPAAMTNGFPDKDKTKVGVGYFRFETPEGKKEVYVGGENSTLDGVASAINQAGLGVKASVIKDASDPENSFRLMVSGTATGGENAIKYPTLYFLDGDQDIYFDKENPAKNGKVKVDGFEFEVADNKVPDVIPGVTLDLKQAAPGKTVNIGVKENIEVVAGKVKGFVDGVNGVLSFIQSQNALSEKTDTSSTLGGDSLLRSVEQRIRSLVQNPQYGVKSDINRLAQIGITFNRNGLLEYDDKKFNDTLVKNPTAVQRFLSGDGFSTGFVPSLKREIGTVLNTAYGPVAIRKKALQDRITQMNDQIANKERQLGQKEEQLRNKFAKLEETMSKLKGQASQVQAAGMGGGGALPGLG